MVPVISGEQVLRAVPVAVAVEAVHDAFLRHHAGEWVMPSKVYLDSPPHGDFRAMPAAGDGVAVVKWVTSFPGNAGRGLPVVTGLLCVNDGTTGELLAIVDARSVTALRTGAAAAVATRALARPGAATAGLVGCGVHGAWTGRALAAVGYAEGVCADPDAARATAVAGELGAGWRAGSLDEALACDVVSTITPGAQPVVHAGTLRPGQHLNMLGADGPGKAEATVEAVAACRIVCDSWDQASHGGEITEAVAGGLVRREDVRDLGAVLAGEVLGREHDDDITLFDSTGLAIQDLAIAVVVLERWRAGDVDAPVVAL